MKDNHIKNDQYLLFKLGKEVFAIEILRVREVLDYSEPTRVPRSPEILVGLINLRGNVVPVVDMRVLLGLEKVEPNVDSCIIIMEIILLNQSLLVGALVDSVREVVQIGETVIEPPPTLGNRLNTEFINGIGKKDADFVIILNVDRVLSLKELDMVERLSSAAGPHLEVSENEVEQSNGLDV